MRLVLQVRLLVTIEQAADLRATIQRFNAACSFIAAEGFAAGEFSLFKLHQRCYRRTRELFGLASRMTDRALNNVVHVFRRDRKVQPRFKAYGAMPCDDRMLKWFDDSVSILGLSGRHRVSFVCGSYQRERLRFRAGQSDLVERNGQFYLMAVINQPVADIGSAADFIGVDLGITNLASDSDGRVYSGERLERFRRRDRRNSVQLKRKRTRGSKKRLRAIAGRASRFRRHENHCISKAIVQTAKGTKRGIALEDLTGIRKRITVRRKQRDRQGSWAFRQLRSFVEYKAQLAGVPIVLVDPRNTSRTCHRCGHCDKANRKNQAEFACLNCGYSANADFNAAQNIRAWALRKRASELAAEQASRKADGSLLMTELQPLTTS